MVVAPGPTQGHLGELAGGTPCAATQSLGWAALRAARSRKAGEEKLGEWGRGPLRGPPILLKGRYFGEVGMKKRAKENVRWRHLAP